MYFCIQSIVVANTSKKAKQLAKMSTPNGSDHLSTLRACIASIQALLKNFEASLKTPITDPPKNIVNNPHQNSLALLSTAAIVLKAQTTKLSLLILHSPFTPSAITHILTSLSATCLPALMTALELCPPSTNSALLHNHVRTILSRAFRAISALLLVVLPQQDDKRSNSTAHQRREKTLAATGMLWETCDAMAHLASEGLPALAIEKLDTSHSLLKDAIAELEEWDPNEEEDKDDPDTDSDDASDPLPNPLPSSSQTPHLLNLSLRLLRQIRLLYSSLKKRRLRSFPPLTLLSSSSSEPTLSQIKTLDTIITAFGDDFTSTADELACALYSHNDKEVLRLLLFLRGKACASLEVVVMDWRGEEDEFSVRARKWVELFREMDIGEGMMTAEDEEEEEKEDGMGNDTINNSCMGKEGREKLQQQQQQDSEGSSSFKSKLPIR